MFDEERYEVARYAMLKVGWGWEGGGGGRCGVGGREGEGTACRCVMWMFSLSTETGREVSDDLLLLFRDPCGAFIGRVRGGSEQSVHAQWSPGEEGRGA